MTAKLTSKTLFDAVFASIPPDAFIDCGPTSLLEEMALAEDVTAHRPTAHGASFDLDNGGLEDGEEDVAGFTRRTAAPSGSRVVDSATWQTFQVEGTTTNAKGGPLHESAAPPQMIVEIDADDEAVLEATKHTASLSAIREELAATEEAARARRHQVQADAVALLHRSRGDLNPPGGHRRGGNRLVDNARCSADDGVATSSSATAPAAPAAGVATDRAGGGPAPTPLPQTSNGPSHALHPHLTVEEQLALMPPGLSTLHGGRCVMLRHSKGFGFIAPDIGGPDVYFIRDSVATTFTRLALNAYYSTQEMPLPLSVQLVPASTTASVGVTSSTASPSTTQQELQTQSTDVEVVAGAAADRPCESASVPSKTLETSLPPPPVPVASTETSGLPVRVSLDKGFVLAEYSSQPVPVITEDERKRAAEAAALLTPATAQLLQHYLNHSRGGAVALRDAMTFTVHRNRAMGGNSRLLRAEYIRGVPANAYATPTEQAWFWPLFPHAVGQKTPDDASAGTSPHSKSNSHHQHHGSISEGHSHGEAGDPKSASAGSLGSPRLLARYGGAVRMYDPDERRGYIRCDEVGASDVIFYGDVVVWHSDVPPAQRQVREHMRVRYSVAGREKSNKYVASLITAEGDVPFSPETIQFAEDGRDSKVGGAADSTGGERKRARADDDQLLLLEEDDYAMI